ncbi:hypothetical protein KSP39_PZI024276 [Platanthera zijinensis]|uniref:Uncharacterized protein n=1 Tax=Platanthera zijinensis TaxID=2320716 RepID=A0AAP0FTH0_9ASPA
MTALLHLPSTRSLLVCGALILFLLAIVVTIGLCIANVLRKKREAAERTVEIALPGETGEKTVAGWGGIGEVLARKMRWSRRTEPVATEESGVGWQDVEAGGVMATTAGVRGGTSAAVSPLWQRRVLMGDRCQMPRFSGLILYDEAGRLLRRNSGKQEKPVAPATTLKDLL